MTDDKSHLSLSDARAQLGLPPEGGRRRQQRAQSQPPAQPAPPTVDEPLGDMADEIDALFALVQREGYHIAPGGYAVQFDDAGRPRVSLAVYPPSAIGADSTDGQEQADDADGTQRTESSDTGQDATDSDYDAGVPRGE